ncbi:MAG: arsenite methyltransferase [Polyangiaceae bacterium]|nr:arsenite methyltransferase [Polyangiaceae bacterium]
MNQDADAIRATVRAGYAEVAKQQGGGACCGPSCCSPSATKLESAERLGYDPGELAAIPDEANLGLGCGNPTALASLAEGEVVLDLGSGAGIDSLIAARKVGPAGRVIGVDMTPEMLERARDNATKMGVSRIVEFREGVIEALPVVDGSVDVVISNCVINLSPDKPKVFREMFRVLKPGGRVAVSDICLTEPLPPDLASLAEAYVGCVAGALLEKDYVSAVRAAGFTSVTATSKSAAPMFEALAEDPTMKPLIESIGVERLRQVAETIRSVSLQAERP